MLGSVKDIMLEKIEVQNDPNLDKDPYYQERKIQLDKTIKSVDNGTIKMYDFNQSMDKLIAELESQFLHITETKVFKSQRDFIVRYIAKDKRKAAIKFTKELKKSINNLANFPYKCSTSNYYENKNIRDMTLKSYSIIYRVKENEKLIEILEIFNKNLPITKED